MVEVIVNHNSDEVRITSDFDKADITIKVSHPAQHRQVLEELLNIINTSAVKLTEINEEVSTTVGEW